MTAVVGFRRTYGLELGNSVRCDEPDAPFQRAYLERLDGGRGHRASGLIGHFAVIDLFISSGLPDLGLSVIPFNVWRRDRLVSRPIGSHAKKISKTIN
jgi:hypothetical protein